eukprot:6527488-Pyramimonas_sp.AAC.1
MSFRSLLLRPHMRERGREETQAIKRQPLFVLGSGISPSPPSGPQGHRGTVLVFQPGAKVVL